jgi:high-affinity K+ transport system ATPase subunit B
MSKRGRKSRNNGNTLVNESDMSGDSKPVIIEWGKKFAAYDRNGKLIILGYSRRIVEGYANEQGKL